MALLSLSPRAFRGPAFKECMKIWNDDEAWQNLCTRSLVTGSLA